MHRFLSLLAVGLSLVFAHAPARAQAPEVTLTRMDCGTGGPPGDMNLRFSDTFSLVGLKMSLVYSCYLIKHGNDYMVWDSGHSMQAGARAPKVSLVDQLAQLNLKPEQIKYIAISHYHGDHIGQVNSFPNSTLLIGKADWEAINSPKPAAMVDPKPFAPWMSGGGKVEPVLLDKDIFEDGSVVMLGMPGHTPGH